MSHSNNEAAGSPETTISSTPTNQETNVEDPKIQRRWNKLADGMDHFHRYFKIEFNNIYELADGSFNRHRMSLQTYLREVDSLKRHLEGHHGIEESYLFPILAKRMPAFAQDEQHRTSHEGIHEGLMRLATLTRSFREEPSSYSPEKMRECLDSFRDILMRHMDEEVEDLKGDNMKKYWTLEEVDKMLL